MTPAVVSSRLLGLPVLLFFFLPSLGIRFFSLFLDDLIRMYIILLFFTPLFSSLVYV